MNSVLDLVVGDRLMDEPPPITLLLACVRHYNTAAVSRYLRRGEEQLHGGWWVREARYGELGTTFGWKFQTRRDNACVVIGLERRCPDRPRQGKARAALSHGKRKEGVVALRYLPCELISRPGQVGAAGSSLCRPINDGRRVMCMSCNPCPGCAPARFPLRWGFAHNLSSLLTPANAIKVLPADSHHGHPVRVHHLRCDSSSPPPHCSLHRHRHRHRH